MKNGGTGAHPSSLNRSVYIFYQPWTREEPDMTRLLLLLPLVWFSFAAKARITLSLLLDSDAAALLDFKEKLGGGGTSLLSWNGSTHFCTWQGVTCGRRHREKVTAVNLGASDLVGPISPSIGNLSFLRSINLSSNGLRGEIPSSIGRLRRLRYLILSSNTIGGEIPVELSNCSELRYIDLSSNQVVGSVPPSLGFLTRLAYLLLFNNSIAGVIPESLANVSSLISLSLYLNHIEGAIPEGFGKLAKIQDLRLAANNLTGVIPTSLYNLTGLTVLTVARNQLHGELSADIGSRLRNLQVILLGGNQFAGPIPASITNCSDLSMFDIANNYFSGRVPSNFGKLAGLLIFIIGGNMLEAQTSDDWDFLTSLTNCSALREFYIDRNNFSGALPPVVANFSNRLQRLSIADNAISGTIPSGIGHLVDLQQLLLYENQLTGSIPEEIGHLRQLQWLYLDWNNLSGEIPSSLSNLTQLNYLIASHNALQGPIPATLGRLQSLTLFISSYNFLDGVIPPEVFDFTFLLDSIDLRSNLLTGSLPSEVGNLKNMRNFLISGNRLQGKIPSTLGDCEVLEYLDLEDNLFQGSIPSTLSHIAGLKAVSLAKNNLSGEIPQTLSSIAGLEQLNLSHNNLSGGIPQALQNLRFLFALDLSFNHLEGAVPTEGVFRNISGVIIDGNDRLCGGVQDLHLPACPRQHSEKRRSKLVPLLIAIPTLCFIFSLFISALIFWRKKRKRQLKSSPSPMEKQYPMISYAELLKSTEGFKSANLIGKGRYGSVYKATLDRENKIVAVKVFDLQQSGSSRSFLAECEALSHIRHRNLIKIITCCSSINSNGDEFKALVFEFMPNKGLDQWLHPQLDEEHRQMGNLSLIQRLNIAVDVAEALNYLHNSCKPPVVHCDLKPSNVLLDEDMVAHVGDFGLAKLLPEVISRSLADSSSIGLRGSIGYVPPEYGEGGNVSKSGDVYSFGVLLLELLTGKSPVDEMFTEGLTLIWFVETRGTREIIDPSLPLHDDHHAMRNSIEECSSSLARVSLACTRQVPRDRICMGEVVVELRAIKNEFVKKTEMISERQSP